MRSTRWTAASFRTQLVVTNICLVAFAMLLLAGGVQLVLARVVSHNVASTLSDQADGVVSALDLSHGGTRIEVPTELLEPGVVVYDADGAVVAGTASPSLVSEVGALAQTSTERTVVVDDDYQLLARPFTLRTEAGDAGASGVVVVTERLAPYEQSERYALLASIALGVFVTLSSALLVWWVTRRALAPVAVMATRAAEWSENDLSRRFDLGEPTNEITTLGVTLDHLLERVSMAIRAEQRLTSELAHELRTPLTSIQGAAELSLMRPGLTEAARLDLEQIASSARTMGATITALLDLARGGDGGVAATSGLGDVVSSAAEATGSLQAVIQLGEDEDRIRLAAPFELAVRALTPVVENAGRHASSRVTISCRASGGQVEIYVDDDGAGLDHGARERLFTPGTSGRDGGTGLGLGIARRTARALGGDVTAEGDRPSGARFVVRLPCL